MLPSLSFLIFIAEADFSMSKKPADLAPYIKASSSGELA